MNWALLLFAMLTLAAAPARAERLVTSVSSSRVLITSSYTGAELVLFGAIERDASSVSRSGPYDIVVTVRGPMQPVVVREKQRLGFVWVNAEQVKYGELPGYLAVYASRPLAEVTSPELRERFQLGVMDVISVRAGGLPMQANRGGDFHAALIRIRTQQNLFQQVDRGVVFLAPQLFRAGISVPATAPLGNYEVTVMLFGDGAPLATEKSNFEVVKTGFEAGVANLAHGQSFNYGLLTAMLALCFGWLANYMFRRD
jgi:uncharacterized protein (TIGR02186 family)